MDTAPRSAFVTATAWSFIIASAFTTMVALLQNIMVWTLFDSGALEEAMAAPVPAGVPAFANAMVMHMPLVSATLLLLSALSLVASIGLLLRRNWARLVFMAMMLVGIAWNLLGLALQFAMMGHMRGFMVDAPPEMPDMGLFLAGIAVVSTIMALAFSALFGWIFWRLRSPAVAAEFTGDGPGTSTR